MGNVLRQTVKLRKEGVSSEFLMDLTVSFSPDRHAVRKHHDADILCGDGPGPLGAEPNGRQHNTL